MTDLKTTRTVFTSVGHSYDAPKGKARFQQGLVKLVQHSADHPDEICHCLVAFKGNVVTHVNYAFHNPGDSEVTVAERINQFIRTLVLAGPRIAQQQGEADQATGQALHVCRISPKVQAKYPWLKKAIRMRNKMAPIMTIDGQKTKIEAYFDSVENLSVFISPAEPPVDQPMKSSEKLTAEMLVAGFDLYFPNQPSKGVLRIREVKVGQHGHGELTYVHFCNMYNGVARSYTYENLSYVLDNAIAWRPQTRPWVLLAGNYEDNPDNEPNWKIDMSFDSLDHLLAELPTVLTYHVIEIRYCRPDGRLVTFTPEQLLGELL